MKAAAYLATRNYYEDVLPSVKSLLVNSDVDKIVLLIEDDTFPYKLPDRVMTVNASKQTYFRKSSPNMKNWWTWMVLLRGAYHRIFPDLDKILSFDADAFAVQDISELWDLDMSDYYLAAVREPKLSTAERTYFNAGIMMLNLAKLRDGTGDRIIRELNTVKHKYPEQDCFTEFCRWKILELPSEYNSTYFTAPCDNPKIIHYADTKDWREKPIVKQFRGMDFKDICG